MFSSSSTTPADRGQKTAKEPAKKKPSHRKTIITLLLFAVWLFLFLFGGITILNPPWLQALSHRGIRTEAISCKTYGDNYLLAKNFRGAIANYQRALRIRPNYTGASVNLAIAYSRIGDNARAEEILQNTLRTEGGQQGVVYYNLGELYERQKKRDAAIQCYQRASETGAEKDLIYRKLGTLYLAAEQYDKAREALEMALGVQLDVTMPYRKMLMTSLVTMDEDTAEMPAIRRELARNVGVEDLDMYDLTLVRSLAQRDPEVARTHNLLGLAHAKLGNNARAIEHFEESLKIWPGNTDAKKNLSVLRQLQEKAQTPAPAK
jgi:tetratricopeptide (TPR) repeat protein